MDRCKPAYLIQGDALHQPMPLPIQVKDTDFSLIQDEHPSGDDKPTVKTDVTPSNLGPVHSGYYTRSKARENRLRCNYVVSSDSELLFHF